MSTFYFDPAIRRRLAEYLGGDSLDTATAFYVTHSDGCLYPQGELHHPADLGKLMDQELDIARSLADREALLFHLDIGKLQETETIKIFLLKRVYSGVLVHFDFLGFPCRKH